MKFGTFIDFEEPITETPRIPAIEQHSSTINGINGLEITKLHPVSAIFDKLVNYAG